MFTTYVLVNSVSKRHYIGCTNDIDRRLSEHNRGQTFSTRKNGMWVIAYTENFRTSQEAKTREKVIKSYKGGNAFKRLLQSSYSSVVEHPA